MPFTLFDHLDPAVVRMERHEAKVARTMATWPSESSAALLNPVESTGVGKCRRAVYYRMTGHTETNPADATACQIMRIGRAMEDEVVAQMKASDLYIANGVKYWVEDVSMSFEVDAVVINPETHQGVLAECKSFDGYFAQKEIIKEGKPKLEHVLQLCIYLNELRTGARLREAVSRGLKERESTPDRAAKHRNRVEANPDNLALMDDGPLAGKLLYVNRTGRDRREFDISLYADADGFHYPAVEAVPWKLFTIESIYDRSKQVQSNYTAAMAEAQSRVKATYGWDEPTKENDEASRNSYWNAIATVLEEVEDKFLPPPDFQYKYDKDKVETLYKLGKVTKEKYTKWKKRHAIIGAWQCRYCSYKNACVGREYPELRYLLLNAGPEPEELTEG